MNYSPYQVSRERSQGDQCRLRRAGGNRCGRRSQTTVDPAALASLRNDLAALAERTAIERLLAQYLTAVCCPLTGNSALEQMARLQGQVAQPRWEHGVLAMSYTKHNGQWLITSLQYQVG
jgi:hypothetical protein